MPFPESSTHHQTIRKKVSGLLEEVAVAWHRRGKIYECQIPRHIGKGECGIVVPLKDETQVAKRPMDLAGLPELQNDAEIHQLVQQAFQSAPLSSRACVLIPRYIEWIEPHDVDWWKEQRHLFFEPGTGIAYGLISERIPAIPKYFRTAVVKKLCPGSLHKAMLADVTNRDCVIRLYLGQDDLRATLYRNKGTFSLRDLPLGPPELRELDFDVISIASSMGEALALMHWAAHVDGNGVEFVLGSGRLRVDDDRRNSTKIWLLDFDQCSRFDPDGGATSYLEQLCGSFWNNHPILPRPSAPERELWEAFESRYIALSSHFTASEGPSLFMDLIKIEDERRRLSADSGKSWSSYHS